MYKQIKYFNGLNALRFFAAYLVVFHHAEQIRLKNALPNFKNLSLFNNGGIAVTFFFVLSGFLISYLLLKEIKQTNTVSIKKFYARRILRIWPLYFLLVIIGTLIIPYFLHLIHNPYVMPYHFKDVILYYVFFSPFMVNILFGHSLIEPLWSIGVEEIFYIIWAPLFKFLKNNILTLTLSVIIFKILLLLFAAKLGLPEIAIKVIDILQFETMAVGGLTAYIIYHRKENIESSFLFSKPFQILMFAFIFLRLVAVNYLSAHFAFFDYLFNTKIASSLLLTFSFAWLIVNVSINKNALLKLNNKLFNFLGNISYGIYMYHMLVVFAIILLLKTKLLSLSTTVASILFYIILTASVIFIAYLSKRYFENYFLKLKAKVRPQSKVVENKLIKQ